MSMCGKKKNATNYRKEKRADKIKAYTLRIKATEVILYANQELCFYFEKFITDIQFLYVGLL